MNHCSARRLAVLLLLPTVLTMTSAGALRGQGQVIGFPETYALARDRGAVVAALIPGTEDWYYYNCRERLDARDFGRVRELLVPWIRRYGRTARVIEIENRDALLSYDQNPSRTYDHIKDRLALQWNHQRTVPGAKSNLPTALDLQLISPTKLTREALRRHPGTIDGFEQRALAALLSTSLNDDQLHSLLGRLTRPDVENLPALVVRDLQHKHSRGFGSLGIHKQLRRAQLDQCARLRPDLLREPQFVRAYLTRLMPRTDEDWTEDQAARAAHLQTLWQFAQRLAPAHNSLKAHVLYHWLRNDLSRGTVDKDRFLTYIRLPRNTGPFAPEFKRRFEGRAQHFVNPGTTYPTGLPPVGNDIALLRACLEHFFASESSIATYAEFLDEKWLNDVLAETKILLGQGDMERWYALINDPRRVEAIEKRVEITFPPTQPRHYAADDAVRLQVDTKNVPTLLIKVFIIDSYRYHVEKQKEVDATIELDGLIANFEQTYDYSEPPLRRVRRTFDLPMLEGPGTYVVEFVGNGISSRAVIHKGSLRHVEWTSAAGQVFRIYDENGTHQEDALVWFGGREYTADNRGDILIPFSTDPGNKHVVLRAGERSSLARFAHRSESFQLEGDAFIERESLIAGQSAKLVVRPQLRLDGHPVSLEGLTNPVLLVTAIDVDGTRRTNEVRNLELVNNREFVHEIGVPDRLTEISITLRGSVQDLSGKKIRLTTDPTTFSINGIDRTSQTIATTLVPDRTGYAIELRGKNGEIAAGQPCTLVFKHRDYKETVRASLQTDAAGRMALGTLPGIDWIEVRIHGGSDAVFRLSSARANQPVALQGSAGETLRIPYQGTSPTVTRQEFSLLAHDDDAFSHLAMADGFVELRDLPAGDYELHLHELSTTIPVRITDGTTDGQWVVGRNRILQASTTEPLHLRAMRIADDAFEVGLTNFTARTRVHLFVTRFQPAFDPFEHLRGSAGPGLLYRGTEQSASSYHAGRKLGDEYRYVLERRFATKFAGNMLQRPGLLLNPWSLERNSWNSAIGLGGGAGGRFGGRAAKSRRGGPADRVPAYDGEMSNGGAFANLNYLPLSAPAILNQTPDETGVVRVPLADLGPGQVIHVIAIDGKEALYDRAIRDEQMLQPRSRALAAALDPEEHFIETKRIEFVDAGGEAIIDDARSAEVEVFDSLAGIYQLMTTISNDANLALFAFILDWPKLEDTAKRDLYGKHACHELHFFIYQKDREFFDAVVRPHLTNKLDKTFVDKWLLGVDLRTYLEPWAFAQLNLIEKILLAQRLDGNERRAIARLIDEQLELRPIDRDRIDALFTTMLAAKELHDNREGASVGLVDQLKLGQKENTTRGREALEKGPATGGPPQQPAAPVRSGRRVAPTSEPSEQADEPVTETISPDADSFALGTRRKQESELFESNRWYKRSEAENLYRAVQPTNMLVENNYWRLPLEQLRPDIVAPNRFWAEYAAASSGDPFVSANFVEASNSFLEMMFALSVIDLPFEAGQHEAVIDGNRRILRAATPLLIVRKEVMRTTVADDEPPLLLGENFFRLDERFQYDNGEKREKFVTDEFLTAVSYGGQVVISNPTGQQRVIDVLLQIPAGALPVQRGFWTRSMAVALKPYETRALEYAFYFPAPGTFEHYPAHAATKGRLVASATGRNFDVVTTPSQVDTRSWEHVSQQGSVNEVLAYLENNNIQRLDLSRIAWRMKSREFFVTATNLLRSRHTYNHVLWSYGLLHRDVGTTREYLSHASDFLQTCGAVLQSELCTIDPIERRTYQQLEFDPLVHARAHRLGSQHVIGNADLAHQYGQLLNVLGYHPRLSSDDWLTVTYYLLLQDRVADALETAAKVIPAELETRVQHDYLQAYMCFFTGETERARGLATAYRDYPVEHWRKRFDEVIAHLDEAEGKANTADDPSNVDLATKAPAIEFVLEGRDARLAYKNIGQCQVRYYELDVEFAFSAQPFASTSGTTAAYVKPSLSEVRVLPEDRDALAFTLPEQFHTKNVLVEVRAGGLVRSRTYFANTLDVRFLESYGQVAVSDPVKNRPLPKTYVKVFAKLPTGQVRFHKDGYTDLRGRFDYASVSDDPNRYANRYAVLVLSDEFGAVIRDVAPPMQ